VNVLVVSRLYPRANDPVVGIFVQEEVRELSRHCQLKVISPLHWFPPLKRFPRWHAYSQMPRREIRAGVEVLRPRTFLLPRNLLFPLMGLTFYLSLRRCARKLGEEFPIDLIHGHTAYPDGFAAVRLGQALGRPSVITLHGGDVNLYFRRLSGRRQGLWAISHADRVIASSNSLRRTVVDEYGAQADKITVIPSGVDVDRFKPLPREEAEITLGLDKAIRRDLYVGAITRSKGIEHLLRAFARLHPATEGPAQLLLIGDGDYANPAQELAQELAIGQHVTFVGKRPNDEIPLWINASDLLVLPSLSEGFGVVLIEALACGKPVVATTCGGPEDIVTPHTGILVPPGDETALADAVAAVLADEHRFSAQAIREYAVDNHAYGRVGGRLLDLYQQVLGPRE
jgi:teichuronic acid biosynthesis glycosyltransferase TuaC